MKPATANKPAAWVAFATDGSESTCFSFSREVAETACEEFGWDMAPLYLAPALTADELKAIEYFAAFQWTMLKPHAATLRGLLEKLGKSNA